MSLQRGINLRALAEKMGQCSGAEVRGICTEAGPFFLSSFPVSQIIHGFESAITRHVRFARTSATRNTRGFRVRRRQGKDIIQ
jgi:26S proteasome regulatory subunit T6